MRWTKTQDLKLKQAVNTFNRKRGAQKRLNPLAEEYLPPKLVYSELKEKFKQSSSREWRDFLASMNRAKKKDAFKLANAQAFVTRYELKEVKLKEKRDYNRMVALEKRMRKDARKKRGKKREIAELKAETIKKARVKTRVNVAELSNADFEEYKNTLGLINQEANISSMFTRDKSAYLKALKNGMGLEEDDELYKMVEALPDEMVSMADTYDEYLNVTVPYSEDEKEELRESLIARWGRYIEAYRNYEK
jgi:hypothetical protein